MKVIKLQDVSVLAALAQAWLMEVRNDFGIDIEVSKHLEDLHVLVSAVESDVLALITDSQQVIGYMGINTFKNPLGRGIVANEHYWYVHPDHRGRGGLVLLKAALEWSKEKGCTHFMANASKLASGLHDKVCRLYEKMGMKHFETTYICEVT